jgi:hypothetical protein
MQEPAIRKKHLAARKAEKRAAKLAAKKARRPARPTGEDACS